MDQMPSPTEPRTICFNAWGYHWLADLLEQGRRDALWTASYLYDPLPTAPGAKCPNSRDHHRLEASSLEDTLFSGDTSGRRLIIVDVPTPDISFDPHVRMLLQRGPELNLDVFLFIGSTQGTLLVTDQNETQYRSIRCLYDEGHCLRMKGFAVLSRDLYSRWLTKRAEDALDDGRNHREPLMQQTD
ncbi:hypothetical protein ml_137 [Mollivirus sibericum]|uniref:hypothetical protein n=1 Tax=Mollivirus sibericum TaxID=1678078 RepID=UPI0006B2E072|nr:hypothetical protein ml_137 [Mollivirus sibericum]ALD61939.1 hypothetical protein ml_137 [Mollivirus sibericum]